MDLENKNTELNELSEFLGSKISQLEKVAYQLDYYKDNLENIQAFPNIDIDDQMKSAWLIENWENFNMDDLEGMIL